MLPDISGPRRRAPPPTGDSFASKGRMTGAAGFKRDNVSGRGVPDPSLTGFSYKDPSAPSSHRGGIAGNNTQSSSFGINPPNDDQLSGTGMGKAFQTASPAK